MMTRNNRLLLGFGVIVLVPVVLVWYTLWPILRAWDLPDAVAGYETQPVVHSLTQHDVALWNIWIHHHRTGWGILGEAPPSQSAGRVIILKTAQGEEIIISLWHFRHGDDVAGIQLQSHGAYRMRSFNEGELLPLIEAGHH